MSEHTTDPDDRTVLTVRVARPEAVFDDLAERFAALDAGEVPDPVYEVVLQREEDVTRLLRPANLELLRTIARSEPASIRETARLVDRDIHQVHDDITDLERMNLLRFENEGRAKRPVVWYDDIDVEVPITGDDGTAV
ncbi:MAG: transcriptional regulator [Halobacteriales archaeon]